MKWLRKPGDPHSGLVALAAVGVLLSVPFVPPTDAYRVRLYAASIVIFGLLPTMGVSLITDRFKFFSQPNSQIQDSNVTAVFGALLVVLVLGGTLLAKFSSQPSSLPAANCPTGEDAIVTRFNAGTSINILGEKIAFLDWMPNFHHGQFRRSVHGLADTHLIEYLESLPAGTSIFSSLDHLSDRTALVILPTSQLPQPGTYIGLCGQWESDPNLSLYGIFYGTERVGYQISQ